MATDWWLLQTCEVPVLRVYGWEEPTLTLGYRQRNNPPDVLEVLSSEVPVVIRPTGGGYLLHADEITYSLAIPDGHPLAELDVHDFYGRVRDAFQRMLVELGLVGETARGEGSGHQASCLAEPGPHEPVEAGAKWMAAAQLRRRTGLLQHGSLFWSPEGWPDPVEDRPHFLGQKSDVSRRWVRDRLIGVAGRVLFPDRPARVLRRSRAEARRITRRRARFEWTGDPPSFEPGQAASPEPGVRRG